MAGMLTEQGKRSLERQKEIKELLKDLNNEELIIELMRRRNFDYRLVWENVNKSPLYKHKGKNNWIYDTKRI